MTDETEARIAQVDFRDFHRPDRRDAFVQAVGRSLETFGFVKIDHHSVDVELLRRAYAAAKELFALPEETKRAYETPADGRQRGYTSKGVEHAKDVEVPDLKEFWQVGRSLGSGHPLHASGAVPVNQHPAEVPDFGPCFDALFLQMEAFANSLLEAVGAYLGLPEDYFRRMVADSNSVIRVIHYPPLSGSVPPGAVRSARHEDINLLTVLPASTHGGLELLTHDGRWLPIHAEPNVMICDTGDMMALLTDGRLKATTHRVVNPEGPAAEEPRYSMPFFLHPHPEHLLVPIAEDSPHEPIKARDFLHRRLVEIGVAD